MTLLEFSWLGVDAVAEGVGALGWSCILRGLSDESRGDENADVLEFVVTRCGARDDVVTADVKGVGVVCVGSGIVRVPPTGTLEP